MIAVPNRLRTRLLSHHPTATDGRPADPAPPDGGERRLGWIAASIAAGAVVVVGATLSTLLPMRDRAEVSVSHQETVATAIPDAPSAPAGTRRPKSAGKASSGPRPATVAAGAGGVVAPSTGAGTAPGPSRPPAVARPRANATAAPATGLPPDLQAAIAAVRATIQHQIDTGQLDRYAGAVLLGEVDQVARALGDRDWTAAADYASTLWVKLGIYREEGKVTTTGYQAIVAALENARASLADR